MLFWTKHPQNRTTRSSPEHYTSWSSSSSSTSSSSYGQRSDLTVSPEPTAPGLLTTQNEEPSSEASNEDFFMDSESALELADSAEFPLPRFSSSCSPERHPQADSRNPQLVNTPSDETCPSLIDDFGSPSALSIGRTISRDSITYPAITNHQELLLLKASTIHHLVGVRVVFDDEWTGFDDLDELEQPEFIKRSEQPKKKFLLNSLTNRSSLGKLSSLVPSPSMDPMLSQLPLGEPSSPLSAPVSPTKPVMSSPTKKTPLFRLFQRPKWSASEASQPFPLANKTEHTRPAPIGYKPVSSSVATSPLRPQSRDFAFECMIVPPTVDDGDDERLVFAHVPNP
ncbi:hypothetical protein [Phaffia rhodozyma]|uniref:Uncharacterized protein n=1 Tax=Phaffia rhodozyma TaxID=264483 RepID=A0A0F7SXD4_PHARH|nr:hypothetical protein [Phaffia rhodozyma]